jgi:CubicO group peptidase (beta-lactamase class C family)
MASLLLLALTLPFAPPSRGADASDPWSRVRQAAEEQIAAGRLSGVSIAIIENDTILFAEGFGFADKTRGIPSTPRTVYRVGSISKLFTAIAAMQLAEEGRLDIDADARSYVPEFNPVNPFPDSAPLTLRQLMCHRSGLVREAPVGGYFDPTEPSARATVASLSDCVLAHPPNTRTKYSNSGVTVVGRAVEEVSGMSFADYQAERILGPIGMGSSAFLLNRSIRPHLARGYLRVADAQGGFREIVAPQFEFGILPAGNLYSTVEDLGRFLSCLFAEGAAENGRILKPETLRSMWQVQLTDATNGFGLGFGMGQRRNYRTFGHAGAVYGFSSQLIALAEPRIGAVVLANDDLALGPVRRLARIALDTALEVRHNLAPPPTPQPEPNPAEAAECVGDYESESFWAKVELAPSGELRLNVSNQRLELTRTGTLRHVANGQLADELPVVFKRGDDGRVSSFTVFDQEFRRVDPDAVQPIPEEWKDYIGSYGPSFIPLIVTVKHGHLYAMTENEFDYRLRPVNRVVFAMPRGLYESEHLVFERNRSGRVRGALLANMPLQRRR